MENQAKKEWSAPALEALNVSETMYGKGNTVIDFITTDDMDIYNPS
ncbi:paeninodin family lasso peptide [Paenibacillus glycinis]|uniref:Paeninodin family lasso peptide n=1 Tax=Paenibacillus glycinis TaxID=2697035 RepID=A0ABW9XUJ9_9BACL|nr:paeninodin family lasso peptide [Paenibacillus glycinis]NBD26348.1 paeninodin family lasso peptide [Paenibacillus glycinis]